MRQMRGNGIEGDVGGKYKERTAFQNVRRHVAEIEWSDRLRGAPASARAGAVAVLPTSEAMLAVGSEVRSGPV